MPFFCFQTTKIPEDDWRMDQRKNFWKNPKHSYIYLCLFLQDREVDEIKEESDDNEEEEVMETEEEHALRGNVS